MSWRVVACRGGATKENICRGVRQVAPLFYDRNNAANSQKSIRNVHQVLSLRVVARLTKDMALSTSLALGSHSVARLTKDMALSTSLALGSHSLLIPAGDNRTI